VRVKCQPYSVVCIKDTVGFRRRAPSWEVRGKATPPEAETLSFWMFSGIHKFTCIFNIWKRKTKITDSLYCARCPAKPDI